MKAEKFLLRGILFSSLQNRTNLHTFFGHICSQFSFRKKFVGKVLNNNFPFTGWSPYPCLRFRFENKKSFGIQVEINKFLSLRSLKVYY